MGGSLIYDDKGWFKGDLHRIHGLSLKCYDVNNVIQSLHEALLNELGVDVHIWSKRVAGVVCSCFDTVVGTSDPYCEICYGTGFVGGYDKLEYNNSDIIKMRIQDFSRALELTDAGYSLTISSKANLSAEPLIKNRDLVYWVSKGLFFEINNYTPKHIKEEISRQEFNLKFLLGNYLIYKLEGL